MRKSVKYIGAFAGVTVCAPIVMLVMALAIAASTQPTPEAAPVATCTRI
jgi:hypothetical protein